MTKTNRKKLRCSRISLRFSLALLISSTQLSQCFTALKTPIHYSTRRNQNGVTSYQNNNDCTSTRQPSQVILHAEKKCPMIVTGSPQAGLGAALALCTRDVLRDASTERPPAPPAQLVALCNYPKETTSPALTASLKNGLLFGQFDIAGLTPNIRDYQHIFSSMDSFLSTIYASRNEYGQNIFHTSIGNKAGLNVSAMSRVLMDLSLRNSMAYLGLHLDMDLVKSEHEDKLILPHYDAIEWGRRLEKLLKGEEITHIPAAVTMDMSTHLAMLQANSLLRSKGVLGKDRDVWAIKDDIVEGFSVLAEESMLFEYHYDFDYPFGGDDPLIVPSKSYMVDTSSDAIETENTDDSKQKAKANDAFAAAYTALRGCDMDPVPSLCIATSVKAVFLEFDSNSVDTYTWDVIDKIAEYSNQARLNAFEEDGAPRKKYKEFGYK